MVGRLLWVQLAGVAGQWSHGDEKWVEEKCLVVNLGGRHGVEVDRHHSAGLFVIFVDRRG